MESYAAPPARAAVYEYVDVDVRVFWEFVFVRLPDFVVASRAMR